MARRRSDDDEDDDRDERPKPPSQNNAYTGLLAITFVALAAAAAVFYIDADELGAAQLAAPSVTVPALGNAPAAPGGAAAGGGGQVAPMPTGM